MTYPTAPDRSLLRLLVWEPVQSFKKKAIQVGIGCWEWLLVARPELEYSVSNPLRVYIAHKIASYHCGYMQANTCIVLDMHVRM